MPKTNRPTADATMTAYLRTLSGANKSASTITAYRTDLKVMMVPLSTRWTTGKSQAPKCGMRQTCHPEALQRAVARGCSSDGHWRT
jgi:site-specific recombinase XerD